MLTTKELLDRINRIDRIFVLLHQILEESVEKQFALGEKKEIILSIL